MAVCSIGSWCRLRTIYYSSLVHRKLKQGGPLLTRGVAFWRKGKEDAPETVEQALEKRKYNPDEDRHVTKQRLNLLASKGKGLTNLKSYKPPEDAEERVQQIAVKMFGDNQEWRDISLKDARKKFKFVSRLIEEFQHDVPNSVLSRMNTVEDAVNHFETEVSQTSRFEDLSKLDLPPNLHIQQEYLRFDPHTDTMFGGRTAFPGRDTHVTSIKYSRKYKGYRTSKDKPGFVNQYIGF